MLNSPRARRRIILEIEKLDIDFYYFLILLVNNTHRIIPTIKYDII